MFQPISPDKSTMQTSKSTLRVNVCVPMRFEYYGFKRFPFEVRLPKGETEGLWAAVYILDGKADVKKTRFGFFSKEEAYKAAAAMLEAFGA